MPHGLKVTCDHDLDPRTGWARLTLLPSVLLPTTALWLHLMDI